jgi:hypothetical protein
MMRRLLIVLVAGALVSACSGSTNGESLTPRITVQEGANGPLAERLLSSDDLHSIAGLPGDVRAVSVNDTSLFSNPDPRGPCGARISLPDLSSASQAGIQSKQLNGFEFIVGPDTAIAQGFVDATISDTQPGCPSYTSITNTGSTQTTALLRVVALPNVADQQTACVLSITNGSDHGEVAAILLRRGNIVDSIVVFAASAPPDDVITALADKAAQKLTG